MPRMRSVKPEFWADEDLAELSRDARLLYIGLWNLADEHGRLRGGARYIKGQLFPYDDDLGPDEVDALLGHLIVAGKVVRYQVNARTYLHLPNLAKHQRLEPDKVPSRLPAPPVSSQPEPDPVPPTPKSESRANESAPHTDTSEPDAKDHALSMLHVAGGMLQQPRARPRAAPAARIVCETIECTAEEADAIVEWIAKERKPRNLTAVVRTIAQAGELPAIYDELRHAVERQATADFIAMAEKGQPCEHGQPGGRMPHPATGEPLCPICRKAVAA